MAQWVKNLTCRFDPWPPSAGEGFGIAASCNVDKDAAQIQRCNLTPSLGMSICCRCGPKKISREINKTKIPALCKKEERSTPPQKKRERKGWFPKEQGKGQQSCRCPGCWEKRDMGNRFSHLFMGPRKITSPSRVKVRIP